MGLYKVLFSDKDLSSSCDSLQVKAGWDNHIPIFLKTNNDG